MLCHFSFFYLIICNKEETLTVTYRERGRFLYSLTLWISIQVNAWANRNYRSACSLWQLYLVYMKRMDGWQCDLLFFFLSFTCAYIPFFSLQLPQETSIISVLFHWPWFLLALSVPMLLVFLHSLLLSLCYSVRWENCALTWHL